ncbi:hypothetical protein [Streptomyces boluensis]|uniref:Uncharacterized protein n=1 Tax=Streptomyces boluensis TaxID=1775135 RepID=A0A964XIS9_9ACTN|nr:hypothetical protein [Streptomyces boluensis]NBE50365.1 hypothetical protein [Streptomyces boluensis]
MEEFEQVCVVAGSGFSRGCRVAEVRECCPPPTEHLGEEYVRAKALSLKAFKAFKAADEALAAEAPRNATRARYLE